MRHGACKVRASFDVTVKFQFNEAETQAAISNTREGTIETNSSTKAELSYCHCTVFFRAFDRADRTIQPERRSGGGDPLVVPIGVTDVVTLGSTILGRAGAERFFEQRACELRAALE
jgi:hypothetical protein